MTACQWSCNADHVMRRILHKMCVIRTKQIPNSLQQQKITFPVVLALWLASDQSMRDASCSAFLGDMTQTAGQHETTTVAVQVYCLFLTKQSLLSSALSLLPSGPFTLMFCNLTSATILLQPHVVCIRSSVCSWLRSGPKTPSLSHLWHPWEGSEMKGGSG